MTRAMLSLLAVSAFVLCGGCKLGQGLHKSMHAGSCGHGCPDGACTHGAPSGHCPTGHCPPGHCATGHCPEATDGHPDPYEPLHLGHQGPPERSGVLSWLGAGGSGGGGGGGGGGNGGIPANAQPAPGPSAGAVSYPYYTNRGPRDFLANDPRGIGPNY